MNLDPNPPKPIRSLQDIYDLPNHLRPPAFRDNFESKTSPPPTLSTKAGNAAKAGVRIAKAAVSGQRVRVSTEERDRRLAICRACEYWNEAGNVGLGECKHPGCGCTRFKHGLATETCPAGKWMTPSPKSFK